jgi:hypothetical protein
MALVLAVVVIAVVDILVDCDLSEEIKWDRASFAQHKKTVATDPVFAGSNLSPPANSPPTLR